MVKKLIAVFDYNTDDCAHTAKAVRQCFAEQNIPAETVEFTAMQPFAFSFKECLDRGAPYDMTFIGVDSMMGVETARNIRELDRWRPMFLVSNVSDYGMEGFRLHALDYLTKPASPLRIKEAVDRIGMRCRADAQWIPGHVAKGSLEVDVLSGQAFIGSKDLLLTKKEFALLLYFMQNEGRCIRADFLYERVWGRPMNENTQALNTSVSRLRKKLQGCGYTLTSEYGNGYRFEQG